VWLDGGDFSSLSGSRNVYDGVRLCSRGDVVVVTVNHRLNAFGYMYLAEAAQQLAAAANPGMLDLVAALRWVRDNIAEFGGDSDNVTIFGQSGGGGKVSTVMAMPDAAGLFHRAIVQSGSYARNAHLQAMSPEEGTRHARTLLAALEIQPGDAETSPRCQWRHWSPALPKWHAVQIGQSGDRLPTARSYPGGPGGQTRPRSRHRCPL
jgi:para-nitrobenzyl esterase